MPSESRWTHVDTVVIFGDVEMFCKSGFLLWAVKDSNLGPID
jgi:hypothetical protein